MAKAYPFGPQIIENAPSNGEKPETIPPSTNSGARLRGFMRMSNEVVDVHLNVVVNMSRNAFSRQNSPTRMKMMVSWARHTQRIPHECIDYVNSWERTGIFLVIIFRVEWRGNIFSVNIFTFLLIKLACTIYQSELYHFVMTSRHQFMMHKLHKQIVHGVLNGKNLSIWPTNNWKRP